MVVVSFMDLPPTKKLTVRSFSDIPQVCCTCEQMLGEFKVMALTLLQCTREEIDHKLGVLSAVCLGDSHIVGDSHQPNSTVGFDSSLHE